MLLMGPRRGSRLHRKRTGPHALQVCCNERIAARCSGLLRLLLLARSGTRASPKLARACRLYGRLHDAETSRLSDALVRSGFVAFDLGSHPHAFAESRLRGRDRLVKRHA